MCKDTAMGFIAMKALAGGLIDNYKACLLYTSVFATGTAAVISPVGELNWDGKDLIINNGKIGEQHQLRYLYLRRSQFPYQLL